MSAKARSIPSAGGSAFSRVSVSAVKSGGSMSGSSSSSTVNARSTAASAVAGIVVRATFGWLAGRRPRSDSTFSIASLTLSSSTSDSTAAP